MEIQVQDLIQEQLQLELRLEHIWAAGVADSATLLEQFGPQEDWQLQLGEYLLLLLPVAKEWYFYDRLHQAWEPSGLKAGAGRFVLVDGRLGIRLHRPQEQDTPAPASAGKRPELPAFRLEIHTPDGEVRQLELQGRLLIGRGEGAGLHLEDKQASRRHALLELVEGGCLLTDLHSANGTYLNGERLQRPQLLEDGDAIQIGSARLVLRRMK